MSYNEKRASYNKQWRQRNKEKVRQYSRDARKNETLEQRQHRLKKSKEYKQNHKKEIKQYVKRYLKEFKETHGISKDQYYYIKHNQSSKDYKNKNKEKIAEYRKKYKKQRYKVRMQTEPLFRAKEKLRSAVQSAFRRIKKNKPANTEKLLGCSWKEAKALIESLWVEGMSWENHGKEQHCWQIDHIRPVASFAEHELDQMNLISNLQPLWIKDNLTKKDKY